MRIAVLGGNGDMGRSLIPHLLEQNHQVVSIDRAMPAPDIARAEVRYLVADSRDFGQVVAAFHGCDGIVHLAAHRSPQNAPDHQIYVENTAGSYHVLLAAAYLGIKRVCMASSINAIGGVFSHEPRYDYFPLDEKHPTYAEDPYSLSKWVLEQQGDAFARRYPDMAIASLRFHWLIATYERAVELSAIIADSARKHLWAYTLLSEAARACLLALTADFVGHEVFYITAPITASKEPSQALAEKHYPAVPLRRPFEGTASFFDCSKAERILGWVHV
jgi:nucleoside-diphosphate-sugar epimerase